MTTKKQEARERKRRVHGGYVNEPLEAETAEPEQQRAPRAERGLFGRGRPAKPVTAKAAPARKASTKSSVTGPRGQKLSRDGDVIVNGRQRVPPPTWRRTLIRTAIFLPIMWIIIHFLFTSSKMTPLDEVLLIGMYAVVTIGVMHFSETFRYNRLNKMLTEAGSPPRA
jgi:hypothetical protein